MMSLRSGAILSLFIIPVMVLQGTIPVYSLPNSTFSNDSFKFHMEINLDIDTSNPSFRYQAIDRHIEFSNPCWATDEKDNSVRVMAYHDGQMDELESQIYNMSFLDGDHIKSCNIVFLIPPYADGNERYYIYYNDKKVDSPEYPDHVSVSEDSFYYEPIPGYKIDMRYYKIIQDGYCIYTVGLGGEITGIKVIHKIIEQRNDSVDFSPRNWVMMASFALFYAVKGTTGIGTDEVLISKDILVDGNLMVRFRISSRSYKDDIRTNNTYTYYYCPTDEKRLIVDAHHKVLKDCISSGSAAQGGSFAYIAASRIRSTNIKELNSGFIPPYIHFFSEQGTVDGYRLPQNPTSSSYEWVLSAEDDCDLGKKAWLSIDEGGRGYAYGVVFSSNNSLYSFGRDGIQIFAGGERWINIPGLEMDGGGASAGRNVFEPNKNEELILPAGLMINITEEFFSVDNGGYKSIDKESSIFQILSRTNDRGVVSERYHNKNLTNKKEYSLTVIPSLQGISKPLLAALFNFSVPTLEIRIYKNGSLVSSALSGRSFIFHLPSEVPKISNVKDFIKKFPILIKGVTIDLKNATVLQQAKFPHLMEGRYVVKVFLDYGNRSRYIGYKMVSLKNNETCLVVCKPESTLKLHVKDQTGIGVKNAIVEIMDNDVCVSKGVTDGSGRVALSFPISKTYNMKILYKGFDVHQEVIRPYSILLYSSRKEVELSLFNLSVSLFDNLNLSFSEPVSLSITGYNKQNKIIPLKEENNRYLFYKIPKGSYTLHLKYKSFVLDKEIRLDKDRDLSIKIPKLCNLRIELFDDRGMSILSKTYFTVERGSYRTTKTSTHGNISLLLPPGEYVISATLNGNMITKQRIDLSNDGAIEIVTSQKSIIFYVIVLTSTLITLILLYMIKRWKNIYPIFILLSISILLFSLSFPLWTLNGHGEDSSVSSNVYILPSSFVTIKHAGSFVSGDIAEVPDLFITILHVILFLIILQILFLLILFLKNLSAKHRILLLTMNIGIFLMIIIIPWILTAEVTNMSVGTVFGSGSIEFLMPDGIYAYMQSSWGLSQGWYLSVLSLVSMAIYIFTSKRH